MAEQIDLYHKWLGIPPEDQPADHYHLLGIKRFESDLDVITNAADRQMSHVKTFQNGPYSTESQQLLNEISAARVCLLNETKKADYDETLKRGMEQSTEMVLQAPSPPKESSPSELSSGDEMPFIPADRPRVATRRKAAKSNQYLRILAAGLATGGAACLLFLVTAAMQDSDDDTGNSSESPGSVAVTTGPAPKLAKAPFNAKQALLHQRTWAKHLQMHTDHTNSIGMKFKLIPAGEFIMGSPKNGKGRFGDETQHRVRITKPCYIGVHPVTRGDFRRFVSESNYRTEGERDGKGGQEYSITGWKYNAKYGWRNAGFTQSDKHPVVNVSWNDAVAFCVWLSKREGRKYRLLTEAEHEYACRAGTIARYISGDNAESLASVGNVTDSTGKKKFPQWRSIKAKDGYVFTSPVGKFKANTFGLYDMHGNVWEWCSDWYGKDYYRNSPPTDPKGPVSGLIRVTRGGSWGCIARLCRSAKRSGKTPDYRDGNIGFRVVMTCPASSKAKPPKGR